MDYVRNSNSLSNCLTHNTFRPALTPYLRVISALILTNTNISGTESFEWGPNY